MKNNLFIFLVTIFLVVLSFVFFLSPKELYSFIDISFLEWAILLIVTMTVFTISGIQYSFLLYQNNKIKLQPMDTVTLPIMMNLWGFIIPFQGSLIFTTLFLKYKYHTRLSQGVILSLVIYIFTLVLTGFVGLFYVIHSEVRSITIKYVSVLFILTPVLILGMNVFLQQIKTVNSLPILTKVQEETKNVVHHIISSFRSLHILFGLTFINILHIALTLVQYYIGSTILEIDISLINLLLLILLLRLLLIMKFTPGNLGLSELLSGGLFSMISLNPSHAVLLVLLVRIVNMILMFTIGFVFTIHNLKYFHSDNFLSFLSFMTKKAKGS